MQCNTFEGEAESSLTAVGARRGLLGLPGWEEEVGLIGIHHRGSFYEFVPNNCDALEWDVDPWGRWRISARSRQHEALVEATCSSPGTPLRAPTADQGLAPFCRDSFGGEVGWARCSPADLLVGGSGACWSPRPSTAATCLFFLRLQVRMRVWEAGRRDHPPLLDCKSVGKSCAVEVGGGPWWSSWQAQAAMAEPVKLLLGLPLDKLGDILPQQLKPPGL